MNKLQINTNPDVALVFRNYPNTVREKMLNLRRLIIEAAEEIETLAEIEETLKWGEPSYLAKKGSTLRIDWKEKNPGQYAIYFKCTSKLVPAFKATYRDLFTFEGNRAIVFNLEDKLPESAVKKCIKAGLTYHHVKNLPNLGLSPISEKD